MHAGQTYTFEVNGNATTGYNWIPTQANSNAFQVISRKYVEGPHSAGMAGFPGKFVFEVKAGQEGSSGKFTI